MPRFLLGLVLAAMAFGAVKFATGDSALAVFTACMMAIGVWFRGFEALSNLAWSGIVWVVRAVCD